MCTQLCGTCSTAALSSHIQTVFVNVFLININYEQSFVSNKTKSAHLVKIYQRYSIFFRYSGFQFSLYVVKKCNLSIQHCLIRTPSHQLILVLDLIVIFCLLKRKKKQWAKDNTDTSQYFSLLLLYCFWWICIHKNKFN